ncbi:MAG: RHS repeat-associated core domain-containing protein [Xanthomonadales bacterium]|nr:RHS repeat-associated core domain-containing protein [Xanthomonadales bacterium]
MRGTILLSGIIAFLLSGPVQGQLIFASGFEEGEGGPGMPPNPEDVAPDRSDGYTTTPCDAFGFLYSGPQPLQFNVDEAQIDCETLSVVSGRVVDRAMNPIPMVRVEILGRPEFGFTLTRADGEYDLAVNGGGTQIISWSAEGYLPAQRTASISARSDQVLEDVMLVTLDTNVTTVMAGMPSAQVVTGSTVTDSDGPRTARLIVPSATSVMMGNGSGGMDPVSQIDVRITEYTVGETGPMAMPADLPPTSGYTYAVELSADQGLDRPVTFSKPLASYNENFLGFPTGTIIPHGYLDRESGQWIPADNGRVIEILSEAAGTVTLAVDSTGFPASPSRLSGLGIDAEELSTLAQLYDAGDSLWRVPISHFSPHDYNFPLPDDAVPPPPPEPQPDTLDGTLSPADYGQIDFESQTFLEQLNLVGVPFALHYASNRVPGRRAERKVSIPVTRSTTPAGLSGVRLKVGGRDITLPPAANQSYLYTWDGLDRYGRPVFGGQTLEYELSYLFQASYGIIVDGGTSAEPPRVFGRLLSTNDEQGRNITVESLPVTYRTRIGGRLDWRPLGVGGWSPSIHHFYDNNAGIIYRGDGSRQSDGGSDLVFTLNDFAGGGDDPDSDGIPANQVEMNAEYLAVASDGTVYYAESGPNGYRIRAIDPDGIVRTVIPGGGTECPGPNTTTDDIGLTELSSSTGNRLITLAVDSRNRLHFGAAFCPGSAYFDGDDEFYPYFIYRVEGDGTVTRVAGFESIQFANTSFFDSIPALAFPMISLDDIEFFDDDTLGIMEFGRFYRLEADGFVRRVAGVSNCFANDCSPDGSVALDALLQPSFDFDTLPDGGLVFNAPNLFDTSIRKITNDGLVQTLLPGQPQRSIDTITTGANGIVYAVSEGELLAVEPDGSTRVIAGGPADQPYASEGGPARQRRFSPDDIAAGPDGSIYSASGNIQRVVPGDEPVPLADTLVASSNSPEVYRFAANGRHLDTRHALTGGLIWSFEYDAEGYLTGVTDGYGNTTNIARNGAGKPTSITGPDNHTTQFSTDINGFLASSTSPGGAEINFAYDPDGLLTQVETASDQAYAMAYDGDGRLLTVTDPLGQVQTLAHSQTPGGQLVTATSPSGLRTEYARSVDVEGTVTTRVTQPDGREVVRVAETDGRISIVGPGGTLVEVISAPDPRFAMQAPYLALSRVSFPGGTSELMTESRDAVLENTGSVLDLLSLTRTFNLGSDVSTYEYSGNTNRETLTTASGLVESHVINAQGDLLERTGTGLSTMTFQVDSRGRVSETLIGEGAAQRTVAFTYGADGQLSSLTGPTGLETQFLFSDDLQLEGFVLPDGNSLLSTYDADGFEIAVTGAGGETVVLVPDERKSLVQMAYPDAGDGVTATNHSYDDDRRVIGESRANGQVLSVGYNPQGRLASVNYSRGQLTYGYDASGRNNSIVSPDVSLSRLFQGPWLARESWSGSIEGTVERIVATDRVQLASVTVNGTDAVAYSYSPLLTQVGSLTLTRDNTTGGIAATTQGLVTDQYQYDAEGRITEYRARISGADYLVQSLQYDAMSRVVQLTETLAGATTTFEYAYDNRSNIESVAVDATLSASYLYDAEANRVSVTTLSGTEAATFDAQNRQLTRGGVSFDFDEDGTLTSTNDGGQITSYLYDEFSNLLLVVLPDGREISYAVDGANRRVERAIDGVRAAAYLYGGDSRPVAELDAANAVTARYVYADRPGAPEYMQRGGITYRLIKDYQGSVRAVVDTGTGAIAQAISYDVWGEILQDTNPGFQPFAFQGGLYDPLTGLTRFGARDYLAESGRWTTRDPIGFAGGSTNFYLFVGNNPATSTDRTGLVAPILIAALIGTGAAAISENVQLQTNLAGGIASGVGANVGGNTLRGLFINAASRESFVSAFGRSAGAAAPFFYGGKFLGWAGRKWGASTVEDVTATANLFGIDQANLTAGEKLALDELLRRLNESDGTNIDELKDIARLLETLRERAEARRKAL